MAGSRGSRPVSFSGHAKDFNAIWGLRFGATAARRTPMVARNVGVTPGLCCGLEPRGTLPLGSTKPMPLLEDEVREYRHDVPGIVLRLIGRVMRSEGTERR